MVKHSMVKHGKAWCTPRDDAAQAFIYMCRCIHHLSLLFAPSRSSLTLLSLFSRSSRALSAYRSSPSPQPSPTLVVYIACSSRLSVRRREIGAADGLGSLA